MKYIRNYALVALLGLKVLFSFYIVAVHCRTRPTTSTTTHGLITMPRHAAELVVPSTTLSEPPTIRFLLIGLQWWVLLLGLFDLGCGFV